MEKKKTKIVKLRKPKKGQTSDYTAILLEEVQDQFRAFGESLDFVRDDVQEIKARLDRIEFEILDIKAELKALRSLLEKKADREYVEKLERRIVRLEHELVSLRKR